MVAKKLAEELLVTPDIVIKLAAECGHTITEGDVISRVLENDIRFAHLKKTHPKLCDKLTDRLPPTMVYERWVATL